MKIHKDKITKEVFWTLCDKCEKKIKDTSELTLKHNLKIIMVNQATTLKEE